MVESPFYLKGETNTLYECVSRCWNELYQTTHHQGFATIAASQFSVNKKKIPTKQPDATVTYQFSVKLLELSYISSTMCVAPVPDFNI